MTSLFKIVLCIFIFTVNRASADDTSCADVLINCASYGKSACKHPYQTWAQNHCAKYCGFCTSSQDSCVDKLQNCETYGLAACRSPYVTWATKNCAKYCGICSNIEVPTSPPLAPTTSGCHDIQPNCVEYGADVCSGHYKPWARQNCAAFCKFCNETTTQPGIPVVFFNGTFPPNGTLNKCFYKDKFYDTNDSWRDGCKFNCTCLDASLGRYRCSTLCYTWTLPSVCTLETPPGKCCPKPVCPPNFHISYPPGYVDQDV